MMPNLPKQNKHKEADFGLKFREWFSKNTDKFISCTFELKQTATDSFPFDHVEEAQIDNAKRTRYSDKGNLVRIERGTKGASDYSFHKKSPAYIFIQYPKGFVGIDIGTFLLEKERSKRKSLKWERA